MSSAVRTDYRACSKCQGRLILATGIRPLDYDPDDAGTFAARHGVHGWEARPYQPGDVLAPLEKRHRAHECPTP